MVRPASAFLKDFSLTNTSFPSGWTSRRPPSRGTRSLQLLRLPLSRLVRSSALLLSLLSDSRLIRPAAFLPVSVLLKANLDIGLDSFLEISFSSDANTRAWSLQVLGSVLRANEKIKLYDHDGGDAKRLPLLEVSALTADSSLNVRLIWLTPSLSACFRLCWKRM
jgi:hypothetical protein